MAPAAIGVVIFAVIGLAIIIQGFVQVQTGTVAVVTMFGKYRRVMQPGLNVRIPLLEQIARRVSIQNQSAELTFQATTVDQANVNFRAMLLYSVADGGDDTIQKVAFKFLNETAFTQALVRSIEGAVREFVATKKQAEILLLRTEIVIHVKSQLDVMLFEWGYHLQDLQINDISFGAAITQSMERVVASQNELVAAENEGKALLIRETKRAEAQGAATQIAAEAEKEASRLRGEGVALFRREVSNGIAEAAEAMSSADLDAGFILFSMWTETMRNVAAEGSGNLITMDGSIEGFERSIRQLMASEIGNRLSDQPASKATVEDDPGPGST